MLLKKILILLLLVNTLSGCAQHKKAVSKRKASRSAVKPKPTKKNKDTDLVVFKEKSDSIVAYAKNFIGIKYKYGGADTKGFDCAGFVCFVYSHFGIKLPRTADAQALIGKDITREAMLPGDLVYFKGRDKRSKAVGHVGIVVANVNGQIKFISATVSSGIHLDELDGLYWKERYIKAKRILH